MSQHDVTLLLGSNLGDKKKHLEMAISKILGAGSIQKKSNFVETQPVEFVSSNIFCNIALRLNTQLSPIKLLKFVKKIEVEMGRKADTAKIGYFTDRIIDIDIVLYDGIFFCSEQLNIPHNKHLFEREFSKNILKEII